MGNTRPVEEGEGLDLVITGVTKRYSKKVCALRELSLTIPAGIFGLMGPAGAGKSTLLRTLATLQEVDSGTVFLGATNVLTEKQAVREILGYLPQEFGCYPHLTTAENLNHVAVLKGISERKARNTQVELFLNQAGLYESRNTRFKKLPPGMKQLLGIAQAFLGAPRLILLDEPTAGLDPGERQYFYNVLAGAGEEVVVIISSNVASDIAATCRRVAILSCGSLILSGETSALLQNLRGSLWRRPVTNEEAASFSKHLNVFSSRFMAGQQNLCVLAESAPEPSFEVIEPTLDDVYSVALKRSSLSVGENA